MRLRWAVVAAGTLVVFAPLSARAISCSGITEAEAISKADVVFDGIAQPGPADAFGFLKPPARFSVISYSKGAGPQVVSVSTLGGDDAGFRSGESWVIFGRGARDEILKTSTCYGSHLAGRAGLFAPASPSPRPTPSVHVEPGFTPPPEDRSWQLWSAGSIVGLGLVMGIGYVVARKVIGTS